MNTIEARLKLRNSRERSPDAGNAVESPSSMVLDIEVPSDISKRIHISRVTKQWRASARLIAILGSCSLTFPRVRSGCRR